MKMCVCHQFRPHDHSLKIPILKSIVIRHQAIRFAIVKKDYVLPPNPVVNRLGSIEKDQCIVLGGQSQGRGHE